MPKPSKKPVEGRTWFRRHLQKQTPDISLQQVVLSWLALSAQQKQAWQLKADQATRNAENQPKMKKEKERASEPQKTSAGPSQKKRRTSSTVTPKQPMKPSLVNLQVTASLPVEVPAPKVMRRRVVAPLQTTPVLSQAAQSSSPFRPGPSSPSALVIMKDECGWCVRPRVEANSAPMMQWAQEALAREHWPSTKQRKKPVRRETEKQIFRGMLDVYTRDAPYLQSVRKRGKR